MTRSQLVALVMVAAQNGEVGTPQQRRTSHRRGLPEAVWAVRHALVAIAVAAARGVIHRHGTDARGGGLPRLEHDVGRAGHPRGGDELVGQVRPRLPADVSGFVDG